MFAYYPQTPKVKGYGVGRLRHPFASRLEVADVPRESVVQGGLGDKQSPGIIFKPGYTFSNLSGTPSPFGSNLATPHGPIRSGVDPAARYSPYPRGGGGSSKGYVVPGRQDGERYWPPSGGGHGHAPGVLRVHGNNNMPYNYEAGNAAPGAMRAGFNQGVNVFQVPYDPEVHGGIRADGDNDGVDDIGEAFEFPSTPSLSDAVRMASSVARGALWAANGVVSTAVEVIRRGANALSPEANRLDTSVIRDAPVGTAAVPSSNIPIAEMSHPMSASPLEMQRQVRQGQPVDPRRAQTMAQLAREVAEGFARNSPETNGLGVVDEALRVPLPGDGASSSNSPTLRLPQVPTAARPKETSAATSARQARATMTTGGPAEAAKTRERKPPTRVSFI